MSWVKEPTFCLLARRKSCFKGSRESLTLHVLLPASVPSANGDRHKTAPQLDHAGPCLSLPWNAWSPAQSPPYFSSYVLVGRVGREPAARHTTAITWDQQELQWIRVMGGYLNRSDRKEASVQEKSSFDFCERSLNKSIVGLCPLR